MQKPAVVFISYSVKDNALASAIHAFLNSSGIRALKAPDDIEPGRDWAAAITAMIESCTHMVLLWSTHSMASREVSKELSLAMQCGAVIIPFRSEDLAPEGAWRYHLSNVQWLEAHTMPEGQALEALLRQVGGGSEMQRLGGSFAQQNKPVLEAPVAQTTSNLVREEQLQRSVVSAAVASPEHETQRDLRAVRRRKLVAGFLALFLGSWGIHKFYLGRIIPGCAYLFMQALTVAIIASTGEKGLVEGSPENLLSGFAILSMFVFCGIVPFAESLTYFFRSPEAFERINLAGKRPWF